MYCFSVELRRVYEPIKYILVASLLLHNYIDVLVQDCGIPWWRYQMETFSALLALCARNSPVTGEFVSCDVTWSFKFYSEYPNYVSCSRTYINQLFKIYLAVNAIEYVPAVQTILLKMADQLSRNYCARSRLHVCCVLSTRCWMKKQCFCEI